MAEENSKIAKNNEERSLEFLKREEIRTMQKDISLLREAESRQEREKIVGLEEIKKAEAEKAKKEAEEKKIALEQLKAEERKKTEEIRRSAWELKEKKTKEKRGQIEKEEASLNEELKNLFTKKTSLKQEQGELLSKIKQSTDELERVKKEEEVIEEAEEKIEEREKRVVSIEEKREIEKERWEISQKRKVIEKKRWELEENIKGMKERLREIDQETEDVLEREKDSQRQKEIIYQRKRELELKTKKKEEEKKERPPEVLPLRPHLRRPSLFKKIFIRGLIILLFLCLLGFIAWSLGFRELSFEKIVPMLKGLISPAVEETVPPIQETVPIPVIEDLENKLGQLFIVGFEGTKISPGLEDFFKKYKPGGVLLLSKNIEGREQLKKLIFDLQTISLENTNLPLFIAVDQEGEPMSRIGFLEENTPQSDIGTTVSAFHVGKRRGEELKELGVNLNLAPVLDAMESEDFYFERTFQKPALEIGELSKALILGQEVAEILTAIKHFPGYVGVGFNPESRLATVENLPEVSQFEKAMEAEPEFVMASNVIYNEVDSSLPFTFSPDAIQLMKNSLGEDVLIISDDLAQTSLLEKFSLKDIVTKPIQAGVDILIFSGWRISVKEGLDAFLASVEANEVSEERISEAVSKIIKLKKGSLPKEY